MEEVLPVGDGWGIEVVEAARPPLLRPFLTAGKSGCCSGQGGWLSSLQLLHSRKSRGRESRLLVMLASTTVLLIGLMVTLPHLLLFFELPLFPENT